MSEKVEKTLGDLMVNAYMRYQANLAVIGEVIFADHVRPLCQARGWLFIQGTPDDRWAFIREDENGESVRIVPDEDDPETWAIIEMLEMETPDGREIGTFVPEYKGVASWGIKLTLPLSGPPPAEEEAQISLLPDFDLMMETKGYSFIWSIGELLGNGIDAEICPVIRAMGLQSGAYKPLGEAVVTGLRHAYLASVQAVTPDEWKMFENTAAAKLTGYLDNNLLEIKGGDQVRAWGRVHIVEKIGPGEYGLRELGSPSKIKPEPLSPDFFGKLELIRPESE